MEEFDEITQNEIFSEGYVKKRLIKWSIRTVVAVILYVIFWEHYWVRWSLWIYVPLNLIGMVFILLLPWYLKRKHKKVANKLDEL